MAEAKYRRVDESALKAARKRALKKKLLETGLKAAAKEGLGAVGVQIPSLSSVLGGGAGSAAGGAASSIGSAAGAAAGPATSGGFFSGLGGMGVLGPAAVAAIAAPAIASVLGAGSRTKYREDKRRAALADRMDLSNVPQANKEFNVKRGGTGKDMLGSAALYELFGTDDDPEKLAALADALIKRGDVSNFKGTVDIGKERLGRNVGNFSDEALAKDMDIKRAAAQQYGEIAKLAQEMGVTIDDEGFRRKLEKLSLSGLQKQDPQSDSLSGGRLGGLGKLTQIAMEQKIKKNRGEEVAPLYDQALWDVFSQARGATAAPTQTVDTSSQEPTVRKPMLPELNPDQTGAIASLGKLIPGAGNPPPAATQSLGPIPDLLDGGSWQNLAAMNKGGRFRGPDMNISEEEIEKRFPGVYTSLFAR